MTGRSSARWWGALACGLLALGPAVAAGEMRTWRDESGKFEVRAELLDFDGKKVRLAKEDGKEITVPLERLCAADRAYVRRVKDDSKEGSKPAGDPSEPVADGAASDDEAETQAKASAADVVRLRDVPAKRAGNPRGVLAWPPSLTTPAAPVGGFVDDPGVAIATRATAIAVEIGRMSDTEHVSRIVPLDTEGRRFLVSVIARDYTKHPPLTGLVYAIDAESGTATVVQKTKELYEILDHDIESGMTLLGERGSKYGLLAASMPTRLVLASGFPEGTPEVKLVRDCPQIATNVAAEVVGARLLSGRHALVSLTTFAGIWELDTGRALQVFPSTGAAVASGGLRYVAIPMANQVVVIEPATRRTVLTVHTALSVSGMAFDPAGRTLAIVEPGWVTIQDCVAGGDPVRFQTPEATGSVAWVAPSLLFMGSGALVDVDRKAVLWKYQLTSGWSVSGSTVAARALEKTYLLSVPHPAAQARRTTWTPVADPILLRHGDSVKVASEVSTGVQIDRVALEQTLVDLAQRAGYRVANDASTTLVARLDRLAPRTVRLGFGGFGIGRGSGPGGPPSMEANPLVASVEFRTPSGVAWSQNLVNSTSPVVMLQQNESLEQGIRRLETPSVATFASMALPTTVERPEVVAGRGLSLPEAGGWKDLVLDSSQSTHDLMVDTDRKLRETIAEANDIREKSLEMLRNPGTMGTAIDPQKLDEAVNERNRRDRELQGGATPTPPVAAGWVAAILAVVLVPAFAMAAAVWVIFTKAGRQGWECVIPFYNSVVFLDIAGLPAWLLVFYFLPQIGAVIVSAAGLAGTAAGVGIVAVGMLASTLAYALNCHGVARNFGKGIGFACGIFFVPFVFLPILAFGKARYRRR